VSKSKKYERNIDLVEDDRWKRKGGTIMKNRAEPIVCPDCKGMGTIDNIHPCGTCQGEGEIWD